MNGTTRKVIILLLAMVAFVGMICFGSMFLFGGKAEAQEQPRELIAHYAFEDGSGYDAVSKTENLTIFGSPQVVAGKDGNGWLFDGKSGAVMQNTPVLGGDYTLTFSFKADALPAGMQMLVGKSNYSSNDYREWALAVATESGTRMYIILNSWNTQTNAWDPISSYVSVGEFHDIAIEVNDSIVNLFVDGDCVGGLALAGRNVTQAPILIGHGVNGTANQQLFQGVIDELKIYTGTEARDSMKESLSNENLALRYSFERSASTQIHDESGNENVAALYPESLKTTASTSRIGAGYRENGAYLNGKNIVKSEYSFDISKDFSVSAYFKADKLITDDQVVFGQVNYGLGQREFAVYITPNGNLRLNAWVNGAWKSGIYGEVVEGRWYHVALTVESGIAIGWLNGYECFRLDISGVSANTGAVFTVGGAMNGSNAYLVMTAAFDEVRVYNRALTGDEIWNSLGDDMIKAKRETVHIGEEAIQTDVRDIKDEFVQFVSIQKSDLDGYKWQHGAAIAFYDGKFFATWGRNLGEENTAGEECVCYTSEDGEHWEYNATLGEPVEGYGYSHGTLFVQGDKLYALVPFYAGSDGNSSLGIHFRELVMKGFVYDAQSGWRELGFETQGFWPLQQAQKMADGNYIIPGVDGDWRAAVAISNGEDMTSWTVVEIPQLGTGFSESNLIVDDEKITIYMRNQKAFDAENVTIGVAYSYDCGRTWSIAQETDLSACTSKPSTGVLTTGERFLITNSIKGANNSRNTLTLALTAPGGEVFENIYVIRDMAIPANLREVYTETELNLSLSYPFALEKDGKLYIVYSSFAYSGTNYNHIEMAVIDLSFLDAERAAEDFEKEFADVLVGEMNVVRIELARTAFESLGDDVRAVLAENGSAAKLETVLAKITAEECARSAREKAETLINMINNADAVTILQIKDEVASLWTEMAPFEKAYVSLDDVKFIETFIAMQ